MFINKGIFNIKQEFKTKDMADFITFYFRRRYWDWKKEKLQ